MKPSSYKTGLAAESLCRLVLRLKFYHILAKRYKTPFGEIDIVALRGNTIVAVEVKARKDLETAASSISPKQQARTANALKTFIARHPKFSAYNLRFDVMLISPRKWPAHIENAWLD